MYNLGLGSSRQEKSPEGLKIEKYSLTYFLNNILNNRAIEAYIMRLPLQAYGRMSYAIPD